MKQAYIFLGPEIGKKQDAIEDIRKKISKGKSAGDADSIEETVFYAGETEAITIANTVQNHSLFAQLRLFIVKNADQIKKKDAITIIASCMEELDPDTVLILTSDEFKLAAGLDNCCPKENRKVFYELFENEKNEWVRSFFRREGRSIDTGGVEAILEMVENNTEALRRECSRLLPFLPKDRSVTTEDIEKWLSINREISPFTLFSRIASGDVSKAIETLHTLLAAKERATGILLILASCFKKLREFLTLSKSGESNSFELKKIGIFAFNKGDYTAAARRYNAQAVDICLAITAEYDLLTRASGTALEEVLLDMYVLKILNPSVEK
ncbi:MAG: DNA polymerase III subunit delta [Treponema sp.]|nr:DNA polymerase III subunit delta [Treponema sp.]